MSESNFKQQNLFSKMSSAEEIESVDNDEDTEDEEEEEELTGWEGHCFSVSEITQYLSDLIEEDGVLGDTVLVQGEVSNVKLSTRGHLYFKLKDEEAAIDAKMWASAVKLLPFELEDGMEIYLTGRLEIYAPYGTYSLTAQKLEPVGVGSLQMAFQQLKEKLEEEGLFAEELKQELPDFPERIGIITSTTGAVIHDMLRVIRRKNPLVNVLIKGVKVQGDGAAQEIAAALKELNHPSYNLDVIILGRGGGSFEDLFCFSEEKVVRAVFESQVPIVTGIGHEPDFSLADAAADHSASTPTAAAEMAVPDVEQLVNTLSFFKKHLLQTIIHRFEQFEQRFDYAATGFLESAQNTLTVTAQTIQSLKLQIIQTMLHQLDSYGAQVGKAASALEALSPLETLARGYAVAATSKGAVVFSVKQIATGDALTLKFTDGKATCEVKNIDA